MKAKAAWAWLVAAFLLMAIAHIASTNRTVVTGDEKPTNKATKWEYKIYDMTEDVLGGIFRKTDKAGGKTDKAASKTDKLEDKLEASINKLGEEGWELVAVAAPQLIFKRPRP